MDEVIVDCQTGEEEQRVLTAAEVAKREADALEADDMWAQNDMAQAGWRDRLRAEVAFIDSQLATWPPNATDTASALQRVNFLLSATKRIARNQSRIMQFIDDATMDSGA
jgi:hypothetical protein